jgi:hypothetical protein
VWRKLLNQELRCSYSSLHSVHEIKEVTMSLVHSHKKFVHNFGEEISWTKGRKYEDNIKMDVDEPGLCL